MSTRLRVFLIGTTNDDAEALRVKVAGNRALDAIGVAAKRDVDHGRVLVPADVDAVLMSPAALAAAPQSGAATRREELIEALTSREEDVLALLADGYGNREIGARLGVSEHTVKFHLASIFGKLGASTRTEAVRRGLELGLVVI